MAIMSSSSGRSLLSMTLLVATLLGCHSEDICNGATLIATGTISTGTVIAEFDDKTLDGCCTECSSRPECLCIEFGEEGVCKLFLDPTQNLLDAPNNHTIVFFGGRVTADPVVTMFNGEKLYWSAPKDAAYNMLSAPGFAINAAIGDFGLSGAGTGEHNNEWLVAIGARFAEATLEIALDTSVAVDTFADNAGVVRMHVADQVAELLSVKINGQDAAHMLGSGATFQAEGSSIYFPKSSSNPVVGVVAVLRTDKFEVSIYNEDAASYHLDFAVSMFSAVDGAALHGVLGQSWAWRQDGSTATHTIEGEVEDYFVAGGLTGSDFKYSTYNKTSHSIGRKLQGMSVVATARFGM